MSVKNHKVMVDHDVEFEWDYERGLMLCWGKPVVCMWIETTMAGFMSALEKTVGLERFHLALFAAGRDSVEGEWRDIIQRFPTPEEGLAYIGPKYPIVGLGQFEVVSLDRDKKEARFRARNSWESLYQKAMGVCWGTRSLAGKLTGYCEKIFGTNCWAEQLTFIAKGADYDEFEVRASDRTVEAELEILMASDKATKADLSQALEKLRQEVSERRQAEVTNAALAAALKKLEQEIHERQQVEDELRGKLSIIRRQEEAIRAMSTPIIQLWDGVLSMPIIGLVDSIRAAQMMESLLEAITRTQARVTILDLTGVDVIDTTAADHLLKLVRAATLLGSRCLVSGISPAMAQTIVSLGLDLSTLSTFNTLEGALRHAIQGDAPGRVEPSGKLAPA